ncbi:Ferredoxin [Tumidithrix helvetica PCC 7403]|uniref:hypothetical protein n=1 Tax=Tumidithrix helvetica TaxID=3457545 RepID=UPI003C819F5C
MLYIPEDQCVSWEVCRSHCPKGAFQQNANGRYWIDHNLCNSCLHAKFSKLLQQQESSHVLHA